MRHNNFNKLRLPVQCKRCSHIWTPRKNKRPKVCPNCNSQYWYKPRIRKTTMPSPSTKTTTTSATAQIGLKINEAGIPIPHANLELKREVVKKE